jgi:hydroxymethylglutaryl-CoA lyase
MKIIECPRDAMQGLAQFISTDKKVAYLNALLRVGFDTLDAGSFVSPRVMPQMADTSEVLARLDAGASTTRLLVIVANVRGAEEAAAFPQIHYLGFPLSVSETFQYRNTNQSLENAFQAVQAIQLISLRSAKELVVYLSMGFGNPFGDPYDPEVLIDFVGRLQSFGVRIVSLADTIGVANPELIGRVFESLAARFPEVEFGAHLHSHPASAREKVRAALRSGCRRLDGALNGYGGCPMANDDLVGNVATETILDVLKEEGLSVAIKENHLQTALRLAAEIFPKRDISLHG